MIEKPENVARISQRVAYYLAVDDDDFIKVAHRACRDYHDDEIDEALAYVDMMLADHPRRKPAPAPAMATALPADQLAPIGGVTVRVRGRAYQHIPPKYWKTFASWIAGGSLGTRIAEAGGSVKDWYQVALLSDEQLGSEKIVIVATYSNGELVIYHAHPNIYGYANFVAK